MVIYFSGTGNSRAVASFIATRLESRLLEMTGLPLLEPARNAIINPQPGEPIVWVFPVYSWGIPPVVINFIKNCDLTDVPDTIHHLVITCGDDAGLTARQWRKLVSSRGWTPGSSTSVIMPNTYVLMKGFDTDSPDLAAEKLAKAPAQIEEAIQRIKSLATDDLVTRGRFPRFKSKIIYPWFTRWCMSPKPFHYLSQCISCGKCAASCPMLNITMNPQGHPQWGKTCALCLRCYHICPVHAVAYGKATAGKGQYIYPSNSTK